MTYDPTGRTIVVGTNVGSFFVLDASTGQQLLWVLASRLEKPIEVVKYSPGLFTWLIFRTRVPDLVE